jgi:hypothetical protein
MADRKTVARSAIQRLNQLFEDAPEVDQEEVSRLEAVRLLARNIHRMTAKGYSAPAIVKMMVENGVPITAPTLKSTWRNPRRRPLQRNEQVRPRRSPTTQKPKPHARRGCPQQTGNDPTRLPWCLTRSLGMNWRRPTTTT